MSQAIKKLSNGGGVSQTEQKPKEETPQVRTFKLGEREIETGSLLSIKKNTKDILIPSEEHKISMFPKW